MRALMTLLATVVATQSGCSRPTPQQEFESADAAVQALVVAARSDDVPALLGVLGRDAQPLLDSGDSIQDQNSRARFIQEYDEAHELEDNATGAMTLNVGADKWPFPIPVVQQHDGYWIFDSAAGREEIINRRVGANELAAIQSCLAFVDAQREYYVRNPQQDPLLHYSQQLLSSDGQKDGLYWPAASGEEPSPLGASFANARSEGYFRDATSPPQPYPYHGYVYRLLRAQGPHAEGGAYEYVVRGKMLGGFALLAYPAEYGNSGIVTFIVNHAGVVYSRDLGPDTAKLATIIEIFDPDQSWQREATID